MTIRVTETLVFDARARSIGRTDYDGAITLASERAAALRPALGLGYRGTFDWA